MGSWRTLATLHQGQYRFQGRARMSNVTREAAVCLRISGAREGLNWKQGRDGEWTPIDFLIQVPESERDVELVCEFKAASGEAWFDVESLRLTAGADFR